MTYVWMGLRYYTGRRALRCKTVVKVGAEAPDLVTAGTLEAGDQHQAARPKH